MEQEFLTDYAGHYQWHLTLALKRAKLRRGKVAERYVFTVVAKSEPDSFPEDHGFSFNFKMKTFARKKFTFDLPLAEQYHVRVERFLLLHDAQNATPEVAVPLPLPSFFSSYQSFEEVWSSVANLLGSYMRANAALEETALPDILLKPTPLKQQNAASN